MNPKFIAIFLLAFNLVDANIWTANAPNTCQYKEKVYAVGTTWKDNENCAILECIQSNSVEETTQIKAYKKACDPLPKDCPFLFIYKEDCCLHCAVNQFKNNNNIQTQSLSIEEEWTVEYYSNHECHRDCQTNASPMTCYYHFHIESYQSMARACYACPQNVTDCSRPHCIVSDGISRSVTVANRMMPGPAIEVCHNDVVVVDVTNNMLSDSTTIHWHGMHQKETPYMDGVPHITQCPIPPSTTFRYNFKAEIAGTHWWHSHIGVQRGDGLLGALVVRQSNSSNPHAKLYDFDLSEHKMILQDWVHEFSLPVFTASHFSNGVALPRNLLINGLGRYFRANMSVEASQVPLQLYKVQQGKRYRFRIINGVYLNCPIEVSVDNHTLTVISTDGHDMEATAAGSVITYSGERWDFVINANQTVGNYWIRLKGLSFCDARFNSAFQVAILRYDGAAEVEPSAPLGWAQEPSGTKINTLSANDGLTTSLLRSLPNITSPGIDKDVLKPEADVKFFINFAVYAKNNDIYHPKYYNYNDSIKGKTRTPQLNFITMKLPPYSLLSYRDNIDEDTFCNATTLTDEGIDCNQEFCYCPHVIYAPLNAVVEIIFINEDVFPSSHPLHLHGYAFQVLSVESVAGATVQTIKDMDAQGQLKRNFVQPLIKDTVAVPSSGYTIVRFKAYNPGFWFMHCHLEFHAEAGMSLVLKVGNNQQMPPVPVNFPTCADYMPKVYDDTDDEDEPKNIFDVIRDIIHSIW